VVEYELPQPFEELDHTADVGVVVRGDSAAEALARLVLAMSQLLAGGGDVAVAHSARIEVDGADAVSVAVDVLRELLFRFDCDHQIVSRCRVARFDGTGASLDVMLGPWDERAHEEGTELKAVTLHAARFEREGQGWVGQIVFDV